VRENKKFCRILKRGGLPLLQNTIIQVIILLFPEPSFQDISIVRQAKLVLPDVKIIVLTFHRGTQRSYIFGIHPEHYDKYNKLIADFLKTDWGKTSVRKKNIPFEREL